MNKINNEDTIIGSTVFAVQGDVVIYRKKSSLRDGFDYIFIDYKNGKEASIYLIEDSQDNRDRHFKKVFKALYEQR